MAVDKASKMNGFIKNLASNHKHTREKAFDLLKQFIRSKSNGMSKLEMQKLWRGLYLAMWFCDRPAPQERLAEQLGELFSGFINEKQFGDFLGAFWAIMIREWPEIDQWRVDKFYLLMRRVLRHSLIFLKKHDYKELLVAEYLKVMQKYPLCGDKSVAYALPYHLCDIYVDELETVMFSDLKTDLDEDEKEVLAEKLEIVSNTPIIELISPFAELNKSASLKTLREKCKNDVLDDKRLVEWGVVKGKSASNNDGSDDDDDSEGEDDEEEEWTGF